MNCREKLLQAVEEAEHGYLSGGRPIPEHLAGIRRILGAPGVGDGCPTCMDAAERAAQDQDKADAKLAKAGLNEALPEDVWGDQQ